jgi:hypothetical protein
MQAAMLMECKRMGVVLQVEATPVVQDDRKSDTTLPKFEFERLE